MQYQRIAGGFLRKLTVILLVCIPAFAFAQEEENESPFYVSAELTSNYLWRGTNSGDFPLVMPTVGFSKGGFEVYAWGAWAFDDSYRELNIGVSYSFSNFTIELVDYFYPWKGNRFFNFSNRSTTHSIEAIATYEPEAFPLHVTVGTTIFGDDKNVNGNNAFSTYAQVGYTHEFNEKNSLMAAAGFSVNKSFYTDYEKGFYPVNLTAGYTRTFFIKDYQLPVYATYVYNPYMKKSFFNVGVVFDIL